jgi:hypothetical protein
MQLCTLPRVGQGSSHSRVPLARTLECPRCVLIMNFLGIVKMAIAVCGFAFRTLLVTRTHLLDDGRWLVTCDKAGSGLDH